MAAMFGNTLGSFHSDVLSAQPTDEVSERVLFVVNERLGRENKVGGGN